MAALPNVSMFPSTLKRIQLFSRPITVLLTVALGLICLIQIPMIAAILFMFDTGSTWHASVSYSGMGLGMSIFDNLAAAPASGVLVETLSFAQRAALAAIAAVHTVLGGLTLHHLRQLFMGYSRGDVFARASAQHMKRFGQWFVVLELVLNVASRLYPLATNAAPTSIPNAALAVILGGMIYVVARVMELAVEADEERKEFV